MHLKKVLYLVLAASLITASLSACSAATPTEDPNLKFTQVAETVYAQLTQSAALTPSATPTLEATATNTAVPATNTPSGPTETPTNTTYPTSVAGANDSIFIKDVTVPDGSTYAHGETFTKTWRFKNTGTTTWSTYYQLVYVEGTAIGAYGTYKVYLPYEVAPGTYLDISVKFTAPESFGSYYSVWKLYTPDGVPFGQYCSTQFNSGAYAATVEFTSTTAAVAEPTPKP